MKILPIGDIHGRTIWKDIIAKEQPDQVVFVGDYLDTHEKVSGAEQLYNLQEIIAYKIANPQTILLIGNHDHHYWPGVGYTGTSGYQPGMAMSFEICFQENKSLFQMCYVDENKIVYSHAGFSDKFLRSIGVVGTDKFDIINDTFIARPKTFCFYRGDFSGYGEHSLQSCIWIRPRSLYDNRIQQLQVIGHTHVEKISHPAKSTRKGFYLIDALGNPNPSYIVINDGKITINHL